MGGFTEIFLRDKSKENIAKHNQMLVDAKVKKSFRFYSMEDVELEYEAYKKGDGEFPGHLFPPFRIHSLTDFMKYWNPQALGSCFVPHIGSLTFDCYFGRTSDNAMKCIKNYIITALLEAPFGEPVFEKVGGSWSTYLERCSASKLDLELINEKIIE